MATHFSILAWKMPWTEEPGIRPWGRKELDTTDTHALALIYLFLGGRGSLASRHM